MTIDPGTDGIAESPLIVENISVYSDHTYRNIYIYVYIYIVVQ